VVSVDSNLFVGNCLEFVLNNICYSSDQSQCLSWVSREVCALSTKDIPLKKMSGVRTLNLANPEDGRATVSCIEVFQPYIHKVASVKWDLEFGLWDVVSDCTYVAVSPICEICVFIPAAWCDSIVASSDSTVLWNEFYLRVFILSASYKPLFPLRYPKVPIYHFLDHTIFKPIVSPASHGLHNMDSHAVSYTTPSLRNSSRTYQDLAAYHTNGHSLKYCSSYTVEEKIKVSHLHMFLLHLNSFCTFWWAGVWLLATFEFIPRYLSACWH
jgi:hypothetical protein